jgi:hypothetical protein
MFEEEREKWKILEVTAISNRSAEIDHEILPVKAMIWRTGSFWYELFKKYRNFNKIYLDNVIKI